MNDRGSEWGPDDGEEARRNRQTNADTGAPRQPPGREDRSPGAGPEAGSPAEPGDEADGNPPQARTAPATAGKPDRRGRTSAWRALLAVLLLTAGGLGLLVAWGLSPTSQTPELVEFEVLPGWGASRVSQELERHELVRNRRIFSAYLRLRGLDRSVGEGIYDLDRSWAAPELAATLVRGGRPRTAQVVLPEGIRARDLVERLSAAGLADAESYMKLIEAPGALRPGYLPAGATLEGYLFPASYEIPLSDTPEQTLRRLLKRFEAELAEGVSEELDELELSVHEWVTLASMIQAEAGNDQEMPVIAGVFLNRLEMGMALQSDPTVAYGLGKRLPELDASAGDLRSDHPWNTYTRPGLPQGPISNPGRAALLSPFSAVRVDEQGREYLYFLHGTDAGMPVFRLNTGLDGHNQDVARYLRNQ